MVRGPARRKPAAASRRVSSRPAGAPPSASGVAALEEVLRRYLAFVRDHGRAPSQQNEAERSLYLQYHRDGANSLARRDLPSDTAQKLRREIDEALREQREVWAHVVCSEVWAHVVSNGGRLPRSCKRDPAQRNLADRFRYLQKKRDENPHQVSPDVLAQLSRIITEHATFDKVKADARACSEIEPLRALRVSSWSSGCALSS